MAWQAATKGSVQNDSGSSNSGDAAFSAPRGGDGGGYIGLVEGSQVHVVPASGPNIIVVVKRARFGLDAKVAQHVMTA